MSVLIKGMEMPTNCSDCPMCYDMMECTVAEPIINFFKEELEKFDFCTERHPRCPLVSVGPHGRLIDADELMHEFEKAQQTMAQHGREYSCSFMSSGQEISTEWYCVEDMLENAPTIIEAEEGE